MKKLSFFFLLTGIMFSQPIKIDVRPRIVDDKTVSIVVQIDNKSRRSINHLEGFINVVTDDGNVLKEKRLIIIGPNDPALQNEMTVSRSITLNLIDPFPAYKFNVSKITFSGDYRVYTFHPEIGFYRVD
ncbi:MAG: hypothetical protein QF847_02905 [Candidatus Marinimicrobia bacterium]|jgi:hypothetical protein|nr:hypothetical protein [Candidatus Neomarinimicrobiota bacterium]MDP6726188.1 hypothetical protein [Candidatus Neomarinimicrobiota bacterium]|tara:strand:+ start:4972 stop:5358 length:387 start_codon:yes stop_codon:yes gene_type:complete